MELADGRTFPAKLVGADEASDLAVLKIRVVRSEPTPIGRPSG